MVYADPYIITYPNEKIIRFNHIIPEDILLEDITLHNSQSTRFNGGTKFLYWILQHQILVSDLLKGTKVYPYGLHHDDEEAFIGDIVKPVKEYCGDRVKAWGDNLRIACYRKFVPSFTTKEFYEIEDQLEAADLLACMIEKKCLKNDVEFEEKYCGELPDIKIRPMTPKEVRIEFLTRAYEIQGDETCRILIAQT